MNKNIQDIDNIFKQSIEAYSEMPNATVWNAIDKDLDKKANIQLQKKYNYIKKIAAVLLLLLLSNVTYYQLKQNNQNNVASKNVEFENKTGSQNRTTEKETIISEKVNTEQNIDKKASVDVIISNKNNKNIIKTILKNNFEPSKDYIGSYNYKNEIQHITNKTKNQKQQIFEVNKRVKNKTLKIVDSATISDSENMEIDNDVLSASDLMKNIAINKEAVVFHTPKALNLESYKIIQEVKKKKGENKLMKNGNKFFVTTFFSPEFAFDRLEDDKPEGNRPPPPNSANRPPIDDRKRIKEQENKTTSFSTGLLLDYSISKNWIVQTGINYSAKSNEIAPKKVFAESDNNGKIRYRNNCSFGATFIDPKTGATIAIGDSAFASNTFNKISYVGIPLNISYHFTKNKFIISPIVGATFNFLVKQKANTGLTDALGTINQNNKMIEGLKNSYTYANVGLQLGYAINKKISIIASPNFKFALSSVNKNVIVKAFPNTFGLIAGVKIAL